MMRRDTHTHTVTGSAWLDCLPLELSTCVCPLPFDITHTDTSERKESLHVCVGVKVTISHLRQRALH